MAKVVCESCGSSFPLERVNGMKNCPVCGENLLGEGDVNVSGGDEHPNWITWWYYKDPECGDFSLWDKPPLRPEELELIKEFKAPPRDASGSSEKAKEILRTYVPDAFAEPKEVPKVKCPYCFSSEVQILPKRFSLLTGFTTNKFERVCIRCKRKF